MRKTHGPPKFFQFAGHFNF